MASQLALSAREENIAGFAHDGASVDAGTPVVGPDIGPSAVEPENTSSTPGIALSHYTSLARNAAITIATYVFFGFALGLTIVWVLFLLWLVVKLFITTFF
jgi:hypothetical protein